MNMIRSGCTAFSKKDKLRFQALICDLQPPFSRRAQCRPTVSHVQVIFDEGLTTYYLIILKHAVYLQVSISQDLRLILCMSFLHFL